MKQSKRVFELILFEVTEDLFYSIITDKKEGVNIFKWTLEEGAKFDSGVPKKKISEWITLYLKLESKKYIRFVAGKQGELEFKPTLKWKINRLYSHKGLTFWSVIIGAIGVMITIWFPMYCNDNKNKPEEPKRHLIPKEKKSLPIGDSLPRHQKFSIIHVDSELKK